MWGIWDCYARDWYRELPSKVDDGGIAILAFSARDKALNRAAKAWGFDDVDEASESGNFEVRKLPNVEPTESDILAALDFGKTVDQHLKH